MNTEIKFDLEKAVAGEPLITRDGREVSEFHYFKTKAGDYPCHAIIDGDVYVYSKTGRYSSNRIDNPLDLFMKPKVIERWFNVYCNGVDINTGIGYDTEERAKKHTDHPEYIKTIKIDNSKP